MAILFYADNADDEIVVSFSDTANNGTPTVLRRFDAPPGLRGLQGVFAHGSFLSMIDWPSKDIFRVPANTANGATIPSSDIFRWNMSSSVTNPLAIAVAPDGTFYVANEAANDEIIVLTPPTVNNGNATEVRKFNMPDAVSTATGMTISPDGETLYVGNQPNRKIVAFPADTENGETPAAADVHEITLPADATSTQGVTLVDGELHIADLGGFVSVITADTDDWATATRSRKYNHPTGIGQIRGIAGWNGATVTLGTPVHVTGNRWKVNATLSGEGLTGFDSSDVHVNLGTVNAVVDEGNNVYRIEVDAPATGSGMITVTVRAGAVRGGNISVNRNFTFPPLPLAIEAIDEQFIAVGTEDYDLVIDITGNPDTVEAKGHMEGFGSHWDAANGQLHIKSDEVTRLISGVNWDVEVVKDMETLMRQVAYNVVAAAPIFETLGTIHLYRGVPINFDIVIQNIPPLLIPNARLLGLKSELVEYGVSVKGSIGTTDNFTVNTGDVRIIVPSETGGADTVYDFPYQIEAGSPPAIGTPTFTPKGHYGVLEVADVTHALGYEWTLQEGDAAVWHSFSDARPVINPSDIEVTPGNLNVAIKFPNIAGASRYEYRLESENHEVDWKRFTGTLANGFITTIIPDLQDGVQYTLRLRVGSPWIGAPVSITVYGGRLMYLLEDASPSKIVLSHTGVADNDFAPTLKTLLLPSSITRPVGLAIDGTTAYVAADPSTNQRIHVLNIDVNDGQQASLTRSFNTGLNFVGDMTIRENIIYMGRENTSGLFDGDIRTFSSATANGATVTLINTYDLDGDRSNYFSSSVDVNDDLLIVAGHLRSGPVNTRISFYPRVPDDYGDVDHVKTINIRRKQGLRGVGISGENLVMPFSDDHIYILSQNLANDIMLDIDSEMIKAIDNPIGITDVQGIFIPKD